jgi:hypothetical protein
MGLEVMGHSPVAEVCHSYRPLKPNEYATLILEFKNVPDIVPANFIGLPLGNAWLNCIIADLNVR